MIIRQITATAVRWQNAGLTAAWADDEISYWVRRNISSDVLMALVQRPGLDHRMPIEWRHYSIGWRIAQLAACPHTRGHCTGILASRGYTGHHNLALFAPGTSI